MTGRFRRSVPVLVVAALGVLTLGCEGQGGGEAAESTAAARVDGTPTYLALGDSIAFGLDPRLVPSPAFSCFSCGSFTSPVPPSSDNVFVGYPEYLQQRLGVPLVNASCPGETSASFGERIKTGQAAICNEFKEQDWLHAGYDGAQQRYARDFLERHPGVELVTVALGANDLLDLVAGCGADPSCVNAGVGGVLLGVHAHMREILFELRSTGYAGPIAVPLYFAPSAAWTELVAALNYHLRLAADELGAVAVDVQTVFGADPCGAGLLIRLDADLGCDVHPSEAGARLIAATIADALGR